MHRLVSFLLGARPSPDPKDKDNRILLKILLVLLGLFLAFLGVSLLVTAANAAGRRAGFRVTELAPGLPAQAYVHFTVPVQGTVRDPELGLALAGVRYQRQVEEFRNGRWGIPAFAHTDDAKDCLAGSIRVSTSVWINLAGFQPYHPANLPGYTPMEAGIFRQGDKRMILRYIPNGTFSFLGMLENGVLVSGLAVPGVESAEEMLVRQGVARASDIERQQRIGSALIYLGLFLVGLARGPLAGLLLSGALATGCSRFLIWMGPL